MCDCKILHFPDEIIFMFAQDIFSILTMHTFEEKK